MGMVATYIQHHSWCTTMVVVLSSELLITNFIKGEENLQVKHQKILRTSSYM